MFLMWYQRGVHEGCVEMFTQSHDHIADRHTRNDSRLIHKQVFVKPVHATHSNLSHADSTTTLTDNADPV